MLDPQLLQVLRHPDNGRPLRQQDDFLIDGHSGDRFPIRSGIPQLLPPSPPLRHRLTRALYDRLAAAYEPTVALGARLGLGHEPDIRRQVLRRIQLPPGARLLEIGCGAAGNRPYLPGEIIYFGLDQAFGILRRAQASLAGAPSPAHLIQADSQQPPLQAGHFDFLLCMGVLQHLQQPRRAFQRWLGLLKPGGHLLLIDEASRLLARLHAPNAEALAQMLAPDGIPFTPPQRRHEYLLLHFHAKD